MGIYPVENQYEKNWRGVLCAPVLPFIGRRLCPDRGNSVEFLADSTQEQAFVVRVDTLLVKRLEGQVQEARLNEMNLRMELDQARQLAAKADSDLHQNIQDQFNEAGVEILSPHYMATRDRNESTIPRKNKPGSN